MPGHTGIASASPPLVFGPFELDVDAGSLRRDGREVTLRPKAWAMLVHLATRPGVLVTTEDLHAAVWGDTAVTPNAMTNVVGELRRALGDGTPPRFIATMRGRGYRFVAATSRGDPHAAATMLARPPSGFVGREEELRQLRQAFASAVAGERQAVLVSGEPGIGKTTLLDEFCRGVPNVVRAQCVESQGAAEAYQPLLSAVEQLLLGARRAETIEVLRSCAPTWLLQIPQLASGDEARALARSLLGVGSARILRDGAILFDELARREPLVLLVEDLHWADHPTVELLATLIQRDPAARLLVVVTWRPVDALVHSHPVTTAVARLQRHRGVRTLPLSAFSLQEVRRCLAVELDDDVLAGRLAPLVGRQSGGNPLFVKAIGRQLREEGWLRRAADGWELTIDLATFVPRLPDDLRALIELQLRSLPDDSQRVLEAAGIAASEITVPLLAHALDWERERVEDVCHDLTQPAIYLQRVPGPTSSGAPSEVHYGFTHALYLRAFRDRTPPSRRRLLHRRIGEHLERAHADPSEVAARLAAHCEAALLLDRAAHYRELAADVALRRLAYAEATRELETALSHLERATDATDVAARRARINLSLGNTRLGILGSAHPLVRDAFERAEHAGREAGDVRVRIRALSGLGTVALGNGNPRAALQLAERQLEASADGELVQFTFLRAGYVRLLLGDLGTAMEHLDRAAAEAPEPGVPMLIDALAEHQCWRALALVQLGAIDEAHRAIAIALERARTATLAWGLGTTIYVALETALVERDLASAARHAAAMLENASRYDLQTHVAIGRFYEHVVRGLRRPARSDLDAARVHLADHEALGERWHRTVHLAALAELEIRCERYDEASRTLDDAMAHAEWGGELWHVPELWRLRGEVALRGRGATDVAEDAFGRAVEQALAKDSVLFALRAALALARITSRRDAVRALRRIRRRFADGSVSVDVREADDWLLIPSASRAG